MEGKVNVYIDEIAKQALVKCDKYGIIKPSHREMFACGYREGINVNPWHSVANGDLPKEGEPHWYIDTFNRIEVCHRDEREDSVVDDNQWESGNYFNSRESAEQMVHKLREVLAGADVIEMPSEEEMREAKPTFSIDYDPYCAEEVRRGFEMCYYWLKSKIVK